MEPDVDLQNYFINHAIEHFEDDVINFNDVEITKNVTFYSFNCTLLFDFTSNKNSVFFRNQLNINTKFNYHNIITFKDYIKYTRSKKINAIKNNQI